MEDLKQALRDFVATSNSGKYTSEEELLSKFPELQGYDINVLRDFVATSNSGRYSNEEELFSKFPEFGQPVKKKEEPQVLPWNQKPAQPKPKPEPALPFLESKPSGISLGSQRVPEAPPMFEAPPMRTPEEAQAIVEAPQTADSEQGWLLNTVSALDRGFAKNLIGNPVKGMGILLEGATGKVFGGSGKGPISDALISFGDYFNKAIDELAPQDEAYKNSLSDQFGQAFGQVASLILTGGVTGAGKEGVALAAAPQGIAGVAKEAGKKLATDIASPTAISAGLSMGQAEFERAKELGATDDQAFEVFYKNAAVGSILEQIPVMQFLKRFNQSSAGGVANYIKTKGVAGLTGGFEEMTTEVLQQLYANKSAQDIYNINQSILEGVGESGGVGFGVGFLLNAMGARAKVLRKEGKPQEAQLIENQIAEFENKPATPPASYSVNGIKIESPNVINDMIETMDVENLTKANIEITNDPVLSEKLQDKMVTSSIKEEVREANPNLDEQTLDQITALEKERRKFEGKKTQSAKDKLSSINSQIKSLQENAVQKPSTEEGVLRPEESQVGLQEVGEGDAKEQAPAEEVVKEEVVTPEEDLTAALERIEIPEDTETLPPAPAPATIDGMSDAEIENRMFEIEGDNKYTNEFNSLEKEMEKRERDSIFNIPLEEVSDSVDVLIKKEKDKPNGFGAFVEKGDAIETKKVADRYLNAKELTDAELMKDFSDAVRGNPTTSYADGLKMREALNEATNRGIDTEVMLADVTKVYTDAGYDIETAKSVVAGMLKPVLKGSKKVSSKTPKAKGVPIPVAIPKPAPAPTPAPAPAPAKEKVPSESFLDVTDNEFPNDHILGGYAVTDEDGGLIGRISLEQFDDNTVKINEVVSEKRGQKTGNGRKIMEKITKLADENGISLTLVPNIIGEMKAKGFETPQKLKDFYKKFGFVVEPNTGRMTRKPMAISAPAPTAVLPEGKVKKLKSLKDIQEDPRVESAGKETDSIDGTSYWVTLKDDYEWAPNSQIIHEYSVASLLAVMNNDVKPVTKPAPAPSAVKAQPFKLSDSLKENVKGILKNAIDSFKKSPKIIKEEISNPYELKVYMQSDTQGFDSDMIFNFKGISNLENAINDIINKFPNLVGISLQVYDPNTEGVTKETPLYYNESSPLEIRNELKKLIEPTPKPAPAPAPSIDKYSISTLSGDEHMVELSYDGKQVGLLTFFREPITINGKKYLVVDQINVREPHRNKGFASKMYEEAIKKLPKEYSGIASQESNRNNKVEIPKIYKKYNPESKTIGREKYVIVNAPKPAPAPSAVVSQPTTKAVGPEALRQEYINKIAEVRLNQDKSRTPKQIDERVKELQAEYNKLKAEMTAPKPKAAPAPKKEAKAPKVEAKVETKTKFQQAQDFADKLSAMTEEERDDVEFDENYRGYQLFEARKVMPKTPNTTKFKKVDENNSSTLYSDYEYIANIDGEPYGLVKYEDPDDPDNDKAFVWAYEKVGTDNLFETVTDDNEELISEIKSQISKEKKTTPTPTPVSVVQEEEPSYDDIKDLDVSDPTFLEIVEGFLDDMDDGLSEFGRGNLSSGIAIPLAKAIIKSLKVLVKAGITLQEAIKRVAAENNIEAKAIVDMIKEVDKAQSPMAKLKAQVQSEVQAAKEGARSVSDAIKAITDYFNFNANRGNLTRRDLGRVINAISKVKDQKSLDKAADKIFAIIDKAKTDIIEVSESKSLISQIKLEARAALGAKKDINQKRKELSNTIKAMETTGKLSAAKAKAILNKIGKVNLDNPASVDAFLDYVENVFEDAAYEVELAGINAKLARAKQNINKKIGTAKTLTTVLNRLFSIKPSLIPVEILDDYKDIIDMFGDSAAVITPEEITKVTQQVQEMLDQIDNQLSSVPALTTKLFNYGKAVLTEEGALDYSATIEKMLSDGTINKAEYDLMKKYKSYILPRAVKIPKTKEELAEEKKVLVKQVKEAANEATISPLASDDEKKMASSVIKLSKTKAVESLDNRQLENLLKIFDNFKNGYFPAYANGINNDLIAAENAGFLSKAIAKAKMPTLAKLKLRITNKRKALFQRVKSTPLFNIDELFGDFKAKDIFNSLFNSLARNQQRYALELEKINQRLEEALNKIAKSYGNNENKIVESKMKMAIYRIQKEFQANPGNPSVNPAIEYINETIKAIKGGNTNYGDEDAKMLEKIAKDYSDGNGGIDAEKLKNSFNTAEQEAIDLFDKINKEVEDKAIFTGDVIRGDKVKLLNEYNHISVLPTKGQEADPIADVMSKFDPKNVVSTKAKSLIERTPEAKAINFDIFSTVQRGAKFVLMDYYLTNPVRIARKTINTTRKMMEENGTLTEDANTIIDVINDALELALKSSLDQAAFNDSFAEQVIKEMAKTGYRSMLGGVPRATTEFTSNMAYIAILAPKEWAAGVKMMKDIDGIKAVNIMKAVGSKAIIRTYGSDPLKGRLVDPSVLSKRVGIGASKLKGETLNVIATIHNNTTKKLKNTAEFTADTLISTPDKIMMRPLWFGSFEKSFEDFSGKKPDLDKIADNDVDYMIKNKEALEAAGRVADEKVVMAGDVDNPYMNALRTYIPSDTSGLAKTFKVFDNFMLKFQIRDYLNARKGIHAMMGNGNISKEQGAKLMAAVVTRTTVYAVMGKMASEFMYGLFLDDEEEDDDKSFAQKLGQGLASTFTSLLFGRDYGNSIRSVVNYGIEKANEKYLDFLRDGEYDPYEDAIQYTFIPPEKKGKSLEAFDVIANISGPYSPALKSLDFVTKKLTEKPKKEGAAIERQEAEKAVRLPLEIFGNLGYVPLYKDIRAIVNKSIYSELDKELDEQGKKEEEFKPMGLNKSDLKRYYPEIYEQYYGEGTEDAARRKLEQEREVLERRMKDNYYNYVPKQEMKKSSRKRSGGIERRMRK